MIFFEWDEEKYSMGIREIDMQHRQLVNLLNQLYDAMYLGQGKNALASVLNSLVRYTQVHFATEERLMKAHGYPEYLKHKDIHAKMTQKVIELQKDFQNGIISSPVQISNFLKNWLQKHILGTDKKYSAFFKHKGVQ